MDRDAAPSLLELLGAIEDPRDPRGRIHPLPAILGLVAVALMAGRRGLESIAQFGRDHGPGLAWRLGFRRGKTPAKSTFSEVLAAVDASAVEAVVRLWAAGRAEAAEALALDGKVLRGTSATDRAGLHLLTLFAPEAAVALGQVPVPPTTNEYRVALELLGVLPIAGKVITADALFCQPEVCRVIREGGGDYLLTVKDNQPDLRAAIASAFAGAEGFSPLAAPCLG
jgi:DDE_Tnp_1-associated/Transposase DDE domain